MLPSDCEGLTSLAEVGSLAASGLGAGTGPSWHRPENTARGNRCGCAEARSLAARIEHRRFFYAKRWDGLLGDSSGEFGSHSRLFLRYQRHKRAFENQGDRSSGEWEIARHGAITTVREVMQDREAVRCAREVRAIGWTSEAHTRARPV